MKLNPKNLAQTLAALVRIPSPPGEEAEIAVEVAGRLEALGLKPRIDKYQNVKAHLGPKGRTILLNAHLDHVPPIGRWSFNPYSGKIAEGKVYGVGASDNKSGVAAMLEIARLLAQREASLPGRIIFLFTSREETHEGKEESRRSALKGLKADAGICLDAHTFENRKTINLEVGCRGILNLTLTIYGKAYHSSEPEKAVNSIYISIEYIQALRRLKLPKRVKPPKAKADLSVTKISTNGWPTRIPDRCTLTINYRALPEENLEHVEHQLVKLAQLKCREGFQVEKAEWSEGYFVPLEEPIVQAAKASIREMGFAARPAIARGWIDAAVFTLKAKIPTIALGTTTKGQAHTPNEYEDLECLNVGAEAVLRTALKFLGG